jgi:hypothetical protein
MYLIQSQLAPTSATVEESVYLTDEAIDSDREIDILISDPTGGLPPQTVASSAAIDSARQMWNG